MVGVSRRSALSPEIASRTIATPIGPLCLAASERGLLLCEFARRGGSRWRRERLERLRELPAGSRPGRAGRPIALLDRAERELARYLEGRLTRFRTPLDLRGNPFQLDVWQELTMIPYGQTRSYGEIAVTLGRPGSARAVGAANGQNPIAIIVPCHRVIGADGRLVGYGGGLELKRALLEHEGALAGLFGLGALEQGPPGSLDSPRS